jgi:hypothetical protein
MGVARPEVEAKWRERVGGMAVEQVRRAGVRRTRRIARRRALGVEASI